MFTTEGLVAPVHQVDPVAPIATADSFIKIKEVLPYG